MQIIFNAEGEKFKRASPDVLKKLAMRSSRHETSAAAIEKLLKDDNKSKVKHD